MTAKVGTLPASYTINVVLAHPRMARHVEVIPREGSKTPKKAQQMNRMNKQAYIGTSFSCRARGSNPGPPDIVILQ